MSAVAEDSVGTGVKIVVEAEAALVSTAEAAEICLTGAAAEQEFGTLVAGAVGAVGQAAETWVAGTAEQVAAETWAAAAAGYSVLGFQVQQTL